MSAPDGPVVLVTAVGEASGSKAAAAVLACAGSEPDRPGLLIDLGGRAPRPTLVASAGARELEERLAVHMPEGRAASRGQTCHLALPADASGIERLPAALALVRDSIGVVHLPPRLLQPLLAESHVRASGVLLRADLEVDRSLAALVAGELIGGDLRVAVLKRPLAWIPSRRALFGVLPAGATGGLPSRVTERLLRQKPSCYGDQDDERTDTERTAREERRGDASPRWGRGVHLDPTRSTDR